MRGLIIKDLLFIKNNYKTTLVMFIGSLLLSIAIGNYLIAISTVPLILLVSSISTFQTDEFFNTEAFTLSLPLSREKIVLSKYVFTLLMTLVSTYIGLVIYLLIYFIISPGFNGVNTDMIKMLLILESAALIVDSIFFPIIYKFGCEKSRFVLMSIIMLLLGIMAIASVYINVINVEQIDLVGIFELINNNALPVMLVLVIVCLILSYFLSVKFFKSKDY